MRRTHRSGVSFVEILTVVAIIAILGAVAVPSYRTYVLKSKIGAMMPLLEEMKQDVVEKRLNGETFGSTITYYVNPSDSNKPANVYQAFIGWHGCLELGWDMAALGLSAGDVRMYMCPYEQGAVIQWACGYHPTFFNSDYVKYLPPDCQKSVSATTYQSPLW